MPYKSGVIALTRLLPVLYSIQSYYCYKSTNHNLGFNHHRKTVQTPKLSLSFFSFFQSDIKLFTTPLSALMQISPFFHNLALLLFSEIVIFRIIGKRTSCRPIRSVIILVINK